jgi:SAM-dependent methyltransferase
MGDIVLPSSDAERLRRALAQLYLEQLKLTPNDYLAYHSSEQAIASKVISFTRYRPFLPTEGRVLDWGCQHAPDAAMVRTVRDSKVSLLGCDFLGAGTYAPFWNYAGLDFVPLEHHVILPFQDKSFDCVIGAGVLEHTAMDYESLKELFRILKPDGHLIITYLPNRFSYTEFLARNVKKRDFHRRLYTVGEVFSMLKHTGFYPLTIQRHRLLPTNNFSSITRLLSSYEPHIDRLWPLSLFCGDIIAIAQRVNSM